MLSEVSSKVCVEVRMIFSPSPEVRIIFLFGAGSKNHFLFGAGSKNHLLVKLTFNYFCIDGYVMLCLFIQL